MKKSKIISEKDLFKREEKNKQILDNGNKVILNLHSKGHFIIEVTKESIKISSKGFANFSRRGFSGSKTISIDKLSGVQYKKSGFFVGYLQFILIGSGESKRGLTGAMSDENTITFANENNDILMQELKAYVEHRIANPNKKEIQNS